MHTQIDNDVISSPCAVSSSDNKMKYTIGTYQEQAEEIDALTNEIASVVETNAAFGSQLMT